MKAGLPFLCLSCHLAFLNSCASQQCSSHLLGELNMPALIAAAGADPAQRRVSRRLTTWSRASATTGTLRCTWMVWRTREPSASYPSSSACCAVLCCAVLCCAVLCCAVLCCAVLC
jgi:hypothetical protein